MHVPPTSIQPAQNQGWLFVRFEIANEHERTVREHTCSRTTYPYTATEQNEQFANTNLFANTANRPDGVKTNGRDVGSLEKYMYHARKLGVIRIRSP